MRHDTPVSSQIKVQVVAPTTPLTPPGPRARSAGTPIQGGTLETPDTMQAHPGDTVSASVEDASDSD